MAASIPIQNHLVMPNSSSDISTPSRINCSSWRLAVETNNLRNWTLVPAECRECIAKYMTSPQYHDDCDLVANEAYKYAQGLVLGGDGLDIWVFDIDETAISNVPYYASLNFKLHQSNETGFYEWMASAEAPAIPATLKLYERLVQLGFKVVFLTAADPCMTEARVKQLKTVGYTDWAKLVLKDVAEEDGVVFKSRKRKELEEEYGYKIRGNIGDQWSDLVGTNTGQRTFKLPNPLYNITSRNILDT